MQKQRVLLALAVLTILLGSFQNCSLYQNEDRKFFEQSSQGLIPTKSPDCLPYLSTAQAIIAFDDPKTTARFVETDIKTCIVSVQNSSMSGVDSSTCTFTAYNAIQAASRPVVSESVIEVFDDPEPKPPGYNSYGYILKTQSNEGDPNFTLIILGAPENATLGTRCGFFFALESDLDENKDKAKNRGFKLLHQINQ